jgi:PAS domain S-box-containing protein
MKYEETYRMFFENSREAVFITTPDGRYLDINPAGVELFGYGSREEMLRLNIDTDIFIDPAARKDYTRRLLESGYVRDYRMELKRKDGRRLVVLTTASAIRDDKGDIIAYQGINYDITEREREKEALRENMDRLDLALKSANMGVWQIDIPNNKLFFSEQSFRLLDIDPSSFRGTHQEFWRVIHPDDLDYMRRNIDVSIEQGMYRTEYRVIWRDGSVHYITGRGKVVKDASGRPVKIHGIHWDITEQKQVDEALRLSEERLKRTLDAAHVVAWEINVDGSHHEAGPVDELFGRQKGFHHPEVSDLLQSVHPEDRENMKELVQAALRGEREYQAEYRVLAEDGTIRWIEAVGTLQRNRSGAPARLLGIARDITEHKRMDDALRRSEERFKQLLQNSNDLIILLDRDCLITSVHGPLEGRLGYRHEELTGLHALDLIHPDDKDNIARALTEGLAQPAASVKTVEYRSRHKNGKWVPLEAVGANLLDDPAVQAIVINVRDISERTRLQEQLQQAMKMEAVGRLAGGVAHDFNNILTTISGNIELARMDIEPSHPVSRCLDHIMKAADSAASLTHQLLAFSRRQIIEPVVLNLNDLVRNVKHMIERLIGENIELKTSLEKALGSVRVDPGQFEQVLVNLAVNARDAMPDGGRLTIETSNITFDEVYCAGHAGAVPGDYVALVVTDTGCGISDDVREHIFEPFFTTKGKTHGTGLGLATIFGIVQQAGGSIDVRSEVGRGSAFRIFIPRAGLQAEGLTKQRPSPEKQKGDETILIVEDDESVREVAVLALKDAGYQVIEASNGDEALLLADKLQGRIDLLMTDVVMPGINGRELSERLAGLYPDMKALFTSGYTEDVILRHGVSDARINFIRKPYSLLNLTGKIREVLDAMK